MMKMLKTHKWFILLLVFQTAVFSWLHMYGVFKNDPDRYFFTGQFMPENEQGYLMCDNCFYLGWGYRQAMDGHVLLEDKFQGYETERNVFHFWWVFGGHVARILHIDLLTFNMIQRVLSGLFLSFVIYLFALDIFKSKRLAIFSVVFYVFASFIHYPWPEGAVFIANSAEVILPLGNALLVLLMYMTYRFYVHKKGNLLALSFTALMLEMDYPYGMIMYSTATVLFLLYLLYTKAHTFGYLLRTFLIITIPAYIVVGYNFYLVYTDYRLVDCQAQMDSPSYWTLFTGYFPFSLLCLLGVAVLFIKHKYDLNASRVYLLFLLFSNLTLIYVPKVIIPFQMEMIVGIQLPLAIFSVDLIRRINKVWVQNALALLLFCATMVPNVLFTEAAMRTIDKKSRPSYLHIEHYQGMQWLDVNTREEDQVLAMNYLASYIPMLTGDRIYIGEYKLISGYFDQRQAKFESAMADTTGATMKHFLQEERIDYVLYCDSMAQIDRSGMLQFEKTDTGYKSHFVNKDVTIIQVP